ncbi:glucurono-1,5-lactonase [Pseudomonas sp. UBA2684]|uniref:glucurono-1,5-lactonase n=1 Tax=Pseudomonas sp. UBA2684 TaxID=1947311 RepID=UPI000E98A6BB|nr:SMP-30/gluconolactonase/LRE family protein [Pseudomonas sp. UBA2684]HBX55842.1 gluconolactonase [Pseudomonas sp.]|tara:strand:- start:1042 stop:1932 length:891 start_codon:yes stop_codon:yes gene_type:complete
MHAELILDARNATGESPVWSAAEQALYWVDIPAKRLHRWSAANGQTQSWAAPQMLACIARCRDGGWIAGMQSGLFHLQTQADGQLSSRLLAGVEHARPDMRFNDGRCDRQGRFWAGSMLLDMSAAAPVGALYRYGADQAEPLSAQLNDFIVPNGLAFSPDGRTLYLSDSHPSVQAIWAFDYDIDSGTPHNRRLFVDMQAHPGRPDGAAVDADGCYWICGNDAGLIHRFTPQGRLDRSLAVPVKKPAMCAFGGRNLDTLYVTSIRPDGVDLADQPLAGGVFALNPGVTGLEEPYFNG